jgi:hypothetical protein
MATTKNSTRNRQTGSSATIEYDSAGTTGASGSTESSSFFARTGRTIKQQPYASAAIATGVVAAGAMFFARRGQSDAENSGTMTSKVKGSFAEARGRIKDLVSSNASSQQSDGRSQREIAEEALTLKETGGANAGSSGSTGSTVATASTSSTGSTGNTLDATSNSEIETGAIAYGA